MSNKHNYSIAREASKRYFSVDLSESTGVLYVNSMKALTWGGLWWMWRNARRILQFGQNSEGCLQMRVGILGYDEFVLISYWESEEALGKAYRAKEHVEMMRYAFQHPEAFELANETYDLPVSTRYLNARNGYALTQPEQRLGFEGFVAQHGTAA